MKPNIKLTPDAQLTELPLAEIDFGIRRREEMGNLEELSQEIQDFGLIHPVTVVDKSKANLNGLEKIQTNNRPYLLLAGGRRYTAFSEFNLGDKIPAYVYPRVLSYYEIRKIELIENTSRKGLTWQEDAVMTAELHELEQKLHGKSVKSASGGHGLKETAEMLGKSKSAVKNEVDLAKAIKFLPELSEIKNKTEALKLIREMKKSDTAKNRAIRARQEIATKGSKGVKADLINQFVLGDFFKHAEKLPEKTFDLIEIDPPYGIDLPNIKKDSKHTTTNYNEVLAKEYENFLRRTFLHAKKLLKPGGWLICWYAISPWHSVVLEQLQKADFKFTQLPGLWIKPNGQTMRPKHHFASCYEPFFYARLTEGAALAKGGQRNYLVHAPVNPDDKFHPTQRPIELMEDLIQRFITDGKILVPFAGSGVTIRAAHNLGMKAIGYDLSEDAKNKYDAYVGNHDMKDKFTL